MSAILGVRLAQVFPSIFYGFELPPRTNLSLDVLFRYLAKWDKDTFIFGTIVTLTMAGLIFGAPPFATILAGCIFTVLYIFLRYALLSVQVRERENNLKVIPRSKARNVIIDNATDQELKSLEGLSEKVKQKRRKSN